MRPRLDGDSRLRRCVCGGELRPRRRSQRRRPPSAGSAQRLRGRASSPRHRMRSAMWCASATWTSA
eukprot:9745658-Alexandrium_andersonii.AAC.1